MAQRVPPQRWFLIFACLALAINSFLPTGARPGESANPANAGHALGTNPLERWLSHVEGLMLAPVREPLYLLSRSMRPGESRKALPMDDKSVLVRRLKEELARRSQLQQRITTLEREVQRLTGSRQLVELEAVRLEPANVTGLIGDSDSPMLELDSGRSSGIRPGLVVVAGTSLVGRVQSASRLTARVSLILTADTRIQARIQPTDPGSRPGAIVERLRLSDEGDYFTVDIPRDSPMQVRDLAHLADDRWPWPARGFVIGKVTDFKRHPQKQLLLKRAVIRPIAALRTLSRVAVLVPEQG